MAELDWDDFKVGDLVRYVQNDSLDGEVTLPIYDYVRTDWMTVHVSEPDGQVGVVLEKSGGDRASSKSTLPVIPVYNVAWQGLGDNALVTAREIEKVA